MTRHSWITYEAKKFNIEVKASENETVFFSQVITALEELRDCLIKEKESMAIPKDGLLYLQEKLE